MYTTTTKAIADYVGKDCGVAMRTLVLKQREQKIVKPKQPTPRDEDDEVSPLDIEEWKTKLSHYYKKQDKYTEDKAKVFIIIMGQCMTAVKNKVEANTAYADIETNYDVVELLRIIKEIAFRSGDKKYNHCSAFYVLKAVLNIRQEKNENPMAYYKRFINAMDVCETQFGPVIPQEIVDKVEDYEIIDEEQQEEAEEKEKTKICSTCLP